MTRLEKCEILKSKGYTYDPETGKIFGVWGREITGKNHNGYIVMGLKEINNLLAHHFAWYMSGKDMDFDRLDHINQNILDNRISNLRIVTHQQNQFNTKAKGYSWDKNRNKWVSLIMLNKKSIHLGRFDTEQEARDAYLEAKKKYHIID
jgi:hypothetical protein